MAALTGHTIASTYKDVLQLSNNNAGLASGMPTVSDGAGYASPLKLSQTQISLNGSIFPTDLGTSGYVLTTNGAGTLSWAAVSGGGSVTADSVTTFTNKSGNISQWTNDSGYITASSASALTNKTGNISQWTNDSAYITASGAAALTNKTGNISQWTNDSGYLTAVVTNANLTGPITSVGNATSIASQTGTGTKFVVDTSPTLVTPVLGVATATSINKLTITQPATGSTLTIQDGFTLTANGNATVSGTNTGDQTITLTGDVTGTGTGSFAASIATSAITGRVADATPDASADYLLSYDASAGALKKVLIQNLPAGAPSSITTANDATNATEYLAFFATAVGTSQPFTNTSLTCNPSTGIITANGFVGNVTGNVSGSSGSCTGNSATVTTNANLTGDITSVGNATTAATALITGKAADATPDAATDYILTYDDSAGALKKVLISNLPGGAATTIPSTNEAADTTCFPLFFNDAVATQAPKTNTSLTFNASTANLGCTTFTGALVGNATTATTLATARDIGGVSFNGSASITPNNITAVNNVTNAAYNVPFFTSATGAVQPQTNASFTYNPGTATLATTTFSGALSGNATTATTLATPRAIGGVNFDGSAAITPDNITAANEATDTTCFPAFFVSATGAMQPKTNASLTFNSNTASLGCTTFVGALTGNVTGNVTGSSGSCTGNAATVTTNANLTGEVTSTGNAAVWDKTAITNRTQDTAPDPAADYVATYDNSATALKKVLLNQLGGWVKISSQTASSSATIDFTGLSTSYRDFIVVLSHIVPATDTADFWFRTSTNNGSTYDSGASDYQWGRMSVSSGAVSALGGSAADTKISLANNLGTGTRETFNGQLTLHDPQGTAGVHVNWENTIYSATPTFFKTSGGGFRNSTADVDAIRFMMSTGNIASGTFTLYGRVA